MAEPIVHTPTNCRSNCRSHLLSRQMGTGDDAVGPPSLQSPTVSDRNGDRNVAGDVRHRETRATGSGRRVSGVMSIDERNSP